MSGLQATFNCLGIATSANSKNVHVVATERNLKHPELNLSNEPNNTLQYVRQMGFVIGKILVNHEHKPWSFFVCWSKILEITIFFFRACFVTASGDC